MEREYYDKSIKIDFELPNYIKVAIENLINERKKEKSLQVDLYEEELMAELNRAMCDGYITQAEVILLRKKYI